MKKLDVTIITPDLSGQDKHKFHSQAKMVTFRALTGEMGILPRRVACSVILGQGVMRVIDEEERKIAIMGGVLHFENDVLTVLTQEAHLPTEIDTTTVKLQIQECESRLTQETSPGVLADIRKDLRRYRILIDATN